LCSQYRESTVIFSFQALQLYGALVPRVLGQKKVRNEECEDRNGEFNLLPAEEFIARHKEAIPCILRSLRAKEEPFNHALVPLLSMLNRITVGGKEVPPELAPFAPIFQELLRSKVFKVRKLAAKSLASFTSDAKVKAQELIDKVKSEKDTNFKHGILLAIKELAKSDEVELEELKKVHFRCFECKLALKDLLPEFKEETGRNVQRWEPGFAKFSEVEEKKIDSSEEKGSEELMRELSENESPLELANCLRKLSNLDLDEEFALELLDFEVPQTGSSAEEAAIVARAAAIGRMSRQEDFHMFFKDESPYTSRFVELSERLRELSRPEKGEDSRLNACRALRKLVSLLMRRDLTCLMQYGVVNLLNSAFILLQDEEVEVREEACEFVAELLAEKPVSHYESMRKLAIFGLKECPECLNWYQPVIDILFSPWREENAENLRKSLKRSYLFESGEGVNVFAEESFKIDLFGRVLTAEVVEKVPINVSQALKEWSEVKKAAENTDFLPFSSFWTSFGYSAMTRFRAFLVLVDKVQVEGEEKENTQNALRELNELLL